MRRVGALVALAAGLLVVVIAVVAGTMDRSDGAVGTPIIPSGPTRPAVVTVDAAGRLPAVPSSFLGVSTEYWTLPLDAGHLRLYERALSLLHVPGGAPLVLRIGGNSSDHTFFDPGITHAPAWAFALTPRWIVRAARLVAATHLHVILDLNLITGSPQLAAAWAAQAERRFPPGSIIGLEVGNEPDLYNSALGQTRVGDAPLGSFDAAALPLRLTATGYARRFDAYARALARVAPGVPLLGPALNHPRRDAGWITTLERAPHPGLREITVHEYPFSGCAHPGTRAFASVAGLLSPYATDSVFGVVSPAVRAAHRARLPLRVTELNSISCGGRRGVSNAFATALWAPGALFELVRAGAVGAELHVRARTVNPPFEITPDGIAVQPLMYGLIAFRSMLGPDARLARVRIADGGRLNLASWAVRVGRRRLEVLIIDRGRHPAAVALRVPGHGRATVQRLLAPSANSATGVTLAGRRLNDKLQWVGRRRVETVARRHGDYRVVVRGLSAAIVSVAVGR